ncbi:hypothetical protein BG015_000947 [Linnemannia schmuckeri]|uniref:HCP-like protein n=1 Tax=Linnemannia schmuckeri TaxID=64567 RepID=A0A9P5RTZ4_9FUNG|nr:hypothetical protein BG015_000947 [Linnemannia schmuckeri]
MTQNTLQGDLPSTPQELTQALRSVERHLSPSSIPPANPDDILYVDCYLDPETKKTIVLWEDIPFSNALQIRQGARVIPFLKGPDFRNLEPLRIAAMPNVVLDVVIDSPSVNMESVSPRNVPEKLMPVLPQEEETTDNNYLVRQEVNATPTVRRNPVYGLEETAMDNYSHIDRPLVFLSARGPHALLNDQSPDSNNPSAPPYQRNKSNPQSRGHQGATANIPMKKDLIQTTISASQGDKDAQVALGDMYHDGKLVPRNYQAAMVWYLKAAEQGDPAGQYYVGALHNSGLGVPQDYAQAMYWYLKAAEQGHAAAQCNVGAFYNLGLGVPQSYATAAEWYQKSADQGFSNAKAALEHLKSYGYVAV